MIYVERGRERPDFFESDEYLALVRDLFVFHVNEGGSRGTQRRFDFDRRFMPFQEPAMAALHRLFRGKCAYTEVRSESLLLDRFRPGSDAVGLDGEVSPDHYWWLIQVWENWYLATPEVVQRKKTTFPVVGERAAAPNDADDRNLLLDPCQDRPEWYLEFLPDGSVHSVPHPDPQERERVEGHDRGALTIELLDLNRAELVAARKRAAEAALYQFISAPSLSFLTPEVEHLGAVRQVLSRQLIQSLALVRTADEAIGDLVAELAPEMAAYLVHHPDEVDKREVARWFPEHGAPIVSRIEDVAPDLARRLKGLEPGGGAERSFSLNVEPASPPRQTRSLPLSRMRQVEEAAPPARERLVVRHGAVVTGVHVENFRAIRELDLAVESSGVALQPEYLSAETEIVSAANWKMLLGENGSGKSSILQAVGLALAGETLFRLPVRPERVLRRGADTGLIRVALAGHDDLELRLTRKAFEYVGGPPDVQTYVRGYGATRLLPSRRDRVSDLHAKVRVSNLFDPRAPVGDAEQWLLALDEGDFNVAAVALATLLGSEQKTPEVAPPLLLARADGQVLVDGDPLDLVSDGYRSVIALACDIMAGAGTGFSDMRNVSGIVLIDEIGAHLHPRWKMSISRALRWIFPNIQFLVSSHEPLCLRGLQKGEVALVRKDAEGVHLEEIDRSPSELRVDQLLTSEYFGLHTTVDPDLDRKFQHYYQLLALPETERAAHQETLDRLRLEVNQHRALGYTRRDQLVYEAIDEFLMEEQLHKPKEERERRKRKTLEAVAKIWELGELRQGLEQRVQQRSKP